MHNQDIDTEVENSCWNVYKNKPTTSDHSCWSDADKFCITWSSKSKSLSPRHGDSFGTYYPARVYSKVTSPPSTNFDVVFRKCHFEDYLSLTLCVKRLNLTAQTKSAQNQLGPKPSRPKTNSAQNSLKPWIDADPSPLRLFPLFFFFFFHRLYYALGVGQSKKFGNLECCNFLKLWATVTCDVNLRPGMGMSQRIHFWYQRKLLKMPIFSRKWTWKNKQTKKHFFCSKDVLERQQLKVLS